MVLTNDLNNVRCVDLTNLAIVLDRRDPAGFPWTQQWEIVPTGNGHGVHVRTVDDLRHPVVIAGVAAYAAQAQLVGNGAQKEFLVLPKNGGFRIAHRLADGATLYWTVDVDGVKLMQEADANSGTQLWKLT